MLLISKSWIIVWIYYEIIWIYYEIIWLYYTPSLQALSRLECGTDLTDSNNSRDGFGSGGGGVSGGGGCCGGRAGSGRSGFGAGVGVAGASEILKDFQSDSVQVIFGPIIAKKAPKTVESSPFYN